MFLTLFYIISSYFKMWQLQNIRTKLLQHVSSLSCVSFYKMSSRTEEFVRACSSYCDEPEKACITDLLFVNGSVYGCALKPLQNVQLNTWRAPPPNPLRIAYIPNVKPHSIHPPIEIPSTSTVEIKKEYLDILLECELGNKDTEEINILPAYDGDDDAWRLVAWKMKDTHLALALHGDLSQLTFLTSSFMTFDSPVTRIMTVKFEGTPIPLTDTECNALSQKNIKGSPRHCSKYIDALEAITDSDSEKISAIFDEVKASDSENNVEEASLSTENDHIAEVTCEERNGNVHADQTEKLMRRKSDLKLNLNDGSNVNKSPLKTIKVTKIQGLDKKNKSTLDEPLYKSTKPTTTKPPNVLIYSESAVTQDNISRALKGVLDPDRYAIYCSGDESKLEAAGSDGTVLLVAGGALTKRASTALLAAFLGGARILSLCSDLLITVLPYYQTAEVRERELVSFTYENWRSVKLLHHVFCYQASPARRQFSAGSGTHPTEYKGHGGHNLKVEVLAAEQTWHTPSLLRASDDQSGGIAVFSQVHLELDSREYLGSDAIPAESARLGVLRNILGSLGLSTIPSPLGSVVSSEPCYTPAYFLGTYERKQEAAEHVAVGCFRLIPPKSVAPTASSDVTPLLLHACPDNFSTVLYFQELKTKQLGRLLIYSEVISSTQAIINEKPRFHGLVILADRQTKGVGRGGTIWLSPIGCLMFSLQIFAPMRSNPITTRAPLMQHLIAVAIVMAIRKEPGYENLDINIKWPNDVYYGRKVKIGGIVLNTSMIDDKMVFNIGVGINLHNEAPTQCLNDIVIKEKLIPFKNEKLLALILNSFESLYNHIEESGDFSQFYENYYKYWLHSNQEVSVVEEGTEDGDKIKCCITGIDEYGYLRAMGPTDEIILHPDGNSFDMMKGLITPKTQTK